MKKNQVKNTLVKSAADKVQKCYNKFLENKPKVEAGRIHMDWQISPEGKVINPGVISSEFNDIPFHQCLTNVIQNVEFPPPPNNTNYYVAHKFILQKQDKSDKKAE